MAPQRDEDQLSGYDWTKREVELLVADYFEMLKAELNSRKYNKAEHRRNLIPLLRGRSDGAIEFKRQNVTAVLLEMGLPYVQGYKPAKNYQRSILPEVIEEYLGLNPHFFGEIASSRVLNPPDNPVPSVVSISSLFESPPQKPEVADGANRRSQQRILRSFDFFKQDAENRRLGASGEKFVVHIEKRRLHEAGRDDLARKVVWASREQGDGLGYDIISWDSVTDQEMFIEVKTTRFGKYAPFYVTSNEALVSEDNSAKYNLYRVFNFFTSPGLYVLKGSLSDTCPLDPVQYRVSFQPIAGGGRSRP